MKIVVAYQWAPDPQEALVGQDGQVDFSRAKPVVNEYDAVAIEVGRQLAGATGATLVGVSVGGSATGKPVATKAALARGLDEVVVVVAGEFEHAGTAATAAALAAVVQDLGDVALVLTGDSSIDSGSKMLPPVLAGTLGWPVLSDVLELSIDGSSLVAERVLGEGRQKVRVSAPAVVALTADATKPRAPGMKDVLAAAKKPVRVTSPVELGQAPLLEGSTRAVAKATGPARKQQVISTTDPAEAAAQLVSALRAADLVTGGRS